MRDLTKSKCDQLLSIPMSGDVTSLNVSVACGLVLYARCFDRGVLISLNYLNIFLYDPLTIINNLLHQSRIWVALNQKGKYETL